MDDQDAWVDAVVDDDVEAMTLLLQSRPQLLNTRLPHSGRPALLLAAAWDAHRAVAFLLERGADVDAADADGSTALHLAAAANAHHCMTLLVGHIRALRCRQSEQKAASPLKSPSTRASRPVVMALGDPGEPAVDRRNRDGFTPLLLGALSGAAECCVLLLSPGGADASLRLPAAPFATATDLALRGRHHAVAAALRRWESA